MTREGGSEGGANAVSPPMHHWYILQCNQEKRVKDPDVLKGVQPGPPVDNVMLCGPFAASFMCEITSDADKLISNQVLVYSTLVQSI